MNAAIQNAIDKIHAQIDILEDKIVRKKEAINTLCETEDEPLLYPDIVRGILTAHISFRSDQFFGKPVATSVKEILEQRGTRLGAISLDELFNTMKAGGFVFENKKDQIAKRNLAITLSMNPSFTRVPSNGHIGLTKWYGNLRKKKDKERENGSAEPSISDSPEGSSR
jgi:hypothetical protein